MIGEVMKYSLQNKFLALCIVILICSVVCADDGYNLWLSCKKLDDAKLLKEYKEAITSIVIQGDSETLCIIRDEVKKGLDGLLGDNLPLSNTLTGKALVIGTPKQSRIIRELDLSGELATLGREGYLIKSVDINSIPSIVITANDDIGLLYGSFHLLRLMQNGKSLTNANIRSKPRIQYRLLNHWDNLEGSVERGYAGKSLWKWNELPETISPRYKDYARANASIGINGTVLNNVNANPNILRTEYLKKVAKLADVFRPYGIRVFLSINFSSPISAQFRVSGNRRGGIGDLKTSDPLNPEVRQWWKNKVREVYQHIPDFGGFLVKANSEGMPGPQDWDRTHADGANMLAEALEPYNGIVMWRAFVYDADVDPDRAKRAYKEFVPLDGKFSPNVFVQAKNGPIDFQPCEPVQPLFGSMPKTPLMLELQITQEYLGHSTHLVYLGPMWKEYLQFDTYAKGPGSTLSSVIDGTLDDYQMTGIAGVTNIGDDRNWCGHFFAQANWFAFGRLAWDHTLTAEQIADEWLRMTITNNDSVVETIKSMMMGSWQACINYMTPLGLHHIMQAGFHYGPQPSYARAQRQDWTSVYYHRADEAGLGFDRSSSGSNATSQYFSPWRERFDSIETCPEKYLLWFHHIPWDYKMKSGRTLWDEMCSRYYEGTDYVDEMYNTWQSLEASIDPEIFAHVKNKLQKQKVDSKLWRDTCINYFRKFSKKPVPDF
jgi:alpha-glucuronidase